ncbi:hypothetical protein ACFWWT_23520 [Streptomyces sp. NPDC058676]|uniref:hypothetical protein n=1 Tax=unclassified Streptomyces TaxID=2593676 RepID=UPI00364ABBD7
MKNVVLMYADPAATDAMTAEERAEVFRRPEALGQDLEGTGETLNGAGPAHPKDTTTIRRHGEGRPRPTGRSPPRPKQLTAIDRSTRAGCRRQRPRGRRGSGEE